MAMLEHEGYPRHEISAKVAGALASSRRVVQKIKQHAGKMPVLRLETDFCRDSCHGLNWTEKRNGAIEPEIPRQKPVANAIKRVLNYECYASHSGIAGSNRASMG
jgi:hypothetical protein